MHQRVNALLCAFVVCVAARSAFADAVRAEHPPAIAIEMYVDPVLAVRVPEMDPPRYETYVRELFRGIAPEIHVVVESAGVRNASHVFVMDFVPAEQRGEVRVTISVKSGRGVTRRMELARVAAITVAAGDAAALEAFLRQQVARVVALYQLRRGVAAAPQGEDRSVTAAELGMTLSIAPHVRGPAAEAVSSVIRTTLATELPGVTLVGPFVSVQEAGTERPMLAVEIMRLDREVGDASVGGGRNRVRVTLTDRERGELLRADEVYDDGDAERALRFLRETIRTVAGKLLEDPLLFPVPEDEMTATAPSAVRGTPAVGSVADDGQTVRTDVHVAAEPFRWRRIIRIGEITIAGLGAATIGFGAWQGLAARSAASEYRRAHVQLEAEHAKRRSEEHAKLANSLFALGAAEVIVGGTSIVLDLSGVYDRWLGRDGRTPAVTIIPTDNGIVGTWSVSMP